MQRILIIILMMVLLLPLAAEKIGGVNMPEELVVGDEKLVLNGAGLRKKVIIKVYACGLYLPDEESDSQKILSDTTAVAVRMHFIYKEVDEAKLIEAWNTGFAKTGADVQYAREVAQFNSFFSEPAIKGDIYDIIYEPGSGIQVLKNNHLKGIIPGSAFRQAVYSIWLLPETDLPKLRDDLLDL